nr:helix-turn-helix domain-containing protein [uncultured Dubosiella sp.]
MIALTTGEKIIELRKRNGYSQEELAEKLDVSRQSVSKWELNASTPDLERIVQMSELFHVSTDYLLKEGDQSQVDTQAGRWLGDEEVERFLAYKRKEQKTLPFAIGLCICSPITLIVLGGLWEGTPQEDRFGGLGMIVLLVLVAIGVGVLIYTSTQGAKFEWIEKEDVRLSERTARMLRQLKNDDELGHAKRMTLGICLCVLSVLPLFVSLFLDPDNGRNMAVSVGVLLFVVAIGAGILIYDGTMQEAVDMLLQEGEYTKKEKRFNRRYGYVPGVYWCLVTAIYLAWSFSTERWDETWLVFAVGGVLYAAVIGVLKAKKAE